jgi:signal peptidase I
MRQDGEEDRMRIWREAMSWVHTFLISIVVAILISIFVFQPSKVMGSSMEPTLENGQRIYISKLPYTLELEPEYGDIVIIDSRVDRERTFWDDVFEHPLVNRLTGQNDRHTWVKRVIGKPGDSIEIRDNQVYRNGDPLTEPYVIEPMLDRLEGAIVVPQGMIFVMGDNRNNSRDSRDIGAVPFDHVLGKKIF